MTRPSQNAPLHTLAGRRGLPHKASPWWRSVYLGLRVGWLRSGNDTTGRWLARLALPDNDVRQVVLGHADDPPVKPDGVRVLTFAQAVTKAQAWATTVQANPHATSRPARRASGGGSPDAVTVRGALLAYAEAKTRGGQMLRASEVRTLVSVHLPAVLGDTPVSGLTPRRSERLAARFSGPCPRPRTASARPIAAGICRRPAWIGRVASARPRTA